MEYKFRQAFIKSLVQRPKGVTGYCFKFDPFAFQPTK